ncbi:MAG: HAMP domain-containing protein [Rhodoferax sp.]|nr:HAMP domain-containing protein [Rhodoferax sp.]
MKTTSIKFRIYVLFVVIISGLLSIFGAISYNKTKTGLEASMNNQLDAALVRLSAGLPNSLWNYDKQQLDQNMESEMAATFIVGISISNGEKVLASAARSADGKIIRDASSPKSDNTRTADLIYKDGAKSNPVGKVTVFVSSNEIKSILQSEMTGTVVEILLLNVIIILVLSRVLNSVVLEPLEEIGNALHDIAVGDADLTKRLPRASSDEFNEVVDGFNTFVERLETIIGKVSSGISTITHASAEIASGNQDLSSRTETQASALQQTASSMEEMTSTVKQNAESAQLANRMVATANEVASKGGTVVAEVIKTMGSINQSSNKIVDIISVIDGIAFQTNILALNAAVEAARAGEQGRGFAVVASEVRSLAGRSAAAAKEIKTLIDDSVSNVNIGTRLVDQAGTTMTEIVESVSKVSNIMAEIMAASSEQTLGIEQINQAVAQMDNSTQQNAALVEQAAAAASSMQSQAADLVDAVSVFILSDNKPHMLALR